MSVTAIKGKQRKVFTDAVWKEMPAHKYGWHQESEVPEEVAAAVESKKILDASSEYLDESMAKFKKLVYDKLLPLNLAEQIKGLQENLEKAVLNLNPNESSSLVKMLEYAWGLAEKAMEDNKNADSEQKNSIPESDQESEVPEEEEQPKDRADYMNLELPELREEITRRGLTYAPAAKEKSLREQLIKNDLDNENKA